MKGLEKRSIFALFALLLAGTMLTSARANSADFNEPSFEEDFSYLEKVEEYVDSYMESITMDDYEDTSETIKIYDKRGALIIEEQLGDSISEDVLRLIRQSDYLTKYENTSYYRLNS